MLVLNIIGVQYLQNLVFSIEKGSDGHTLSDSHCPIKKKSRIKIFHFSLELILSAKICILETWYTIFVLSYRVYEVYIYKRIPRTLRMCDCLWNRAITTNFI